MSLLPCPFCGSPAELFNRFPPQSVGHTGFTYHYWNVRCTGVHCGATIDPAQRSEEACTEAWNNRCRAFGPCALVDPTRSKRRRLT